MGTAQLPLFHPLKIVLASVFMIVTKFDNASDFADVSGYAQEESDDSQGFPYYLSEPLISLANPPPE